jgi:hypothetical protein
MQTLYLVTGGAGLISFQVVKGLRRAVEWFRSTT